VHLQNQPDFKPQRDSVRLHKRFISRISLKHNPAGLTRFCDRHCCCHHHSLGHSLGLCLCGGGGIRPRRRSHHGGGGCRPSSRSHRRPSDRRSDVRRHRQRRQRCRHRQHGGSVRRRALHRESRCNPVGSQSAAGRRRGCGDSSHHHRRFRRRLRHHCSGWYCSSFRWCYRSTPRQLSLQSPLPPRRPVTPSFSAVALAATATITALPSSADSRHTSSAVVLAPFFCFLIADC